MKKDINHSYKSLIKIKISKKVKKILPRALLILGGIIIIGGASYGVVKADDYSQVKQLVKASDNLVKEEKYQDAYNNLSLAKSRWTTAKVRKEIETKMSLEKQLIADQDNYTKGNDLFGQSKWQEAKDSYSKVSNAYPHYSEAQDKIKESQNKIDEANALAEQQKQQAEASAKAKANALAKQQKAATSDPFPPLPDYSKCPPNTSTGLLPSWDNYSCTFDVYKQYLHDKEAWYARHGQTMPQTETKQTNTNCRWIGDYWNCTTN